MSPFLGHQCWYSFNDKPSFPGAKAVLTCCVCADLFCFLFFFLKPRRNVHLTCLRFFVLTRCNTVLKTTLLWSSSSELSERLSSGL